MWHDIPMPKLRPHTLKELPYPPSLWSLLGPSFILLGLGLGSGELILWPYLAAHYGLGIIWGAAIGITLQFFLNMEVERYTLAKGESVFVGLAHRLDQRHHHPTDCCDHDVGAGLLWHNR